MVRLSTSRLARGAAGLLTAGIVLASPLSALAQSAPANPQTLVPGADALGSDWKLFMSAGDQTTWVNLFQPTDASDSTTNISSAAQIFPTTDAVAKEFDNTTAQMKKAGYTVTDVQGIGDKAVKVSGSVGNKKTAESLYLFAIGTTMGGTSAQTKPEKFDAVDAVAIKVANAELALVRSGGAGAAPAQATPGGLAKALALPLGAVGDGWKSQNEQLDPDGKKYSIDYVPTDGSKWQASIALFVLPTPDAAATVVASLADPLRQQGWAVVPQDSYGDGNGLKGTIGTADVAGTMYIMNVGSRVAMVLAIAEPAKSQDASDLADSLAAAQEGRLY